MKNSYWDYFSETSIITDNVNTRYGIYYSCKINESIKFRNICSWNLFVSSLMRFTANFKIHNVTVKNKYEVLFILLMFNNMIVEEESKLRTGAIF